MARLGNLCLIGYGMVLSMIVYSDQEVVVKVDLVIALNGSVL